MAIEMKLPFLGDGIVTADVIKVLVKVGERVEVDQPVLEIETGKASVELPADSGGLIAAIHVKEGDKLKPGQVLFTVDGAEDAKTTTPTAKPDIGPRQVAEQAPQPAAVPGGRMSAAQVTPQAPHLRAVPPVAYFGKLALAAPSLRRLAFELGIDINVVPGSGPSGRITVDDVRRFKSSLSAGRSPAAVRAVELPDFSKWGPIELKPVSHTRRLTAEHLAAAWATIPHVTQFGKADISALETFRKDNAGKVIELGGKLTVTAIVLKVVAGVLKEMPQFNASLDLANDSIVYKNYWHVGVAVDTERGLLVPVIRDVDRKSILGLSVELAQLAEKTRNKGIKLDDLQGGTFTVSNLGGIGGTQFTPVINAPQVAILGVSRSAFEPMFVDGKFEPHLMLPLSLSYDHRLIDGADGARFLRRIVETLENAQAMRLE